MTLDIPYFMTNEKWFYFDPKKQWYFLTDEATEKAEESYKEFCKEFEAVYGE